MLKVMILLSVMYALSRMCSDLRSGFRYLWWKDAVMAFKKHEESKCHKESIEVMLIIPSQHR